MAPSALEPTFTLATLVLVSQSTKAVEAARGRQLYSCVEVFEMITFALRNFRRGKRDTYGLEEISLSSNYRTTTLAGVLGTTTPTSPGQNDI